MKENKMPIVLAKIERYNIEFDNIVSKYGRQWFTTPLAVSPSGRVSDPEAKQYQKILNFKI